MKKTISFCLPALLVMLAAACNEPSSGGETVIEGYIPKDTARLMVGSYLKSIAPEEEGKVPDVRYWTLDADLLRDYLSDPKMKNVSVLLAHSLEYIHSGHEGQPAGYRSDALTIVINGTDSSGNVLYGPPSGTTVPNHSLPCPNNCLIVGP